MTQNSEFLRIQIRGSLSALFRVVPFALVFTFFLTFSTAQADWFEVYWSNDPNELLSIHFPVDNQTGYAVGFGCMLKTTDGGVNWTQLPSLGEAIMSVHFPVDNQTGWVAGLGSSIFKTTDGGANWENQSQTSTIREFMSVYFLDNQTGYVVGQDWDFTAAIFKTTDGGTNWIDQHPGQGAWLNTVHFPVDAQTGYTVGDNVILKTTDGGTNWIPQSSGTSNTLRSIYFPVDNQTGYAVGDNSTFLKTTDGGANWVKSYPIPTGISLQSIHFPVDDQTGFVVGGYSMTENAIFKTTDGGVTWIQQYSINSTDPLRSVYFPVDDQTGYISGGATMINQVILKTTDGGLGIEGETGDAAREVNLLQNNPNPFNQVTWITYEIQTAGDVRIEVFDVTGRKVATLVDCWQEPGVRNVAWDADGITSGVYFYRLSAQDESEMRKMIILE